MKYKVEVSRPGHPDTEETQEAAHLGFLMEKVQAQHPDIEAWQENLSNFPHSATGLKWRADEQGTDKIVVISPA